MSSGAVVSVRVSAIAISSLVAAKYIGSSAI
jgi:hypothetical protein